MGLTKLNLGCGNTPIDGYVNLDIGQGHLAYPLNWKEGTVDEIRASHLLEHFSHRRTVEVLRNWVSKLKPGGVLKVAVPDFRKICQSYVDGQKINTVGYLMGGHVDKYDEHKNLFDRATLTKYLEAVGLRNIQDWQSDIKDCASLPISLNLMGRKAGRNGDGSPKLCEADIQIMRGLWDKRRNVYSQYGEDGIIDAIFEKVGTTNKWCVEVGAGDGITFSNTRRLIDAGWNAVLIEADPEIFKQLETNMQNAVHTGTVIMINRAVDMNENRLDNILVEYNVPKDIDFMSIDIDGQDWHIWNSLLNYQPRIMMVEFDNQVDPDYVPTIDGEGQAGKKAILGLGPSKGYHLALENVVNWIFVHDDCAEKVIPDARNKFLSPIIPVKEDVPAIKIAAVMSMPRLAFTDNMFSAIQSFMPLGITLDRGVGVFWGQVLTRMIEQYLEDGTEWLFTVDYDTWFRREHVQRLCQLMAEHPEADAIIPVQTGRQGLLPLMGRVDSNGNPTTSSARTDFEQVLTSILTGHFGLTIFKMSIFHTLPKPWFLHVPGPDGGWNEGRQDEDIYFWNNFARAGFKAFMANEVNVGHIQLMSTFPGTIKDNWRPIQIYMNEVEQGKVPEHCIPKVEIKR